MTRGGGRISVLDSTVPAGLPNFLRFLNALPEPESVARSLVLGPLAPLDMGTVGIARLNGDAIEVLGTYGYTQEEIDRYVRIPMSVQTPFTRAVEKGEVLIDDMDDLLDTFDALRMDRTLWRGIRDRLGVSQVVSSPIVLQGTVVGVYGGITRSKRTWTSLDFALLDGLSAALGLWITHPLGNLPTPDRFIARDDDSIHLTDRQRRILVLVEQGHSNTSIAMSLGYSVSTIKQELQRSMRATRANDRLEAARRARQLHLLSDDKPITR